MSEIGKQVVAALQVILQSQTLSGNPTVDVELNAEINAEETCRIIISAENAQLYKDSLPGLYTVAGNFTVIQSIDSEGVDSTFDDLCKDVSNIIGMVYQMPDMIHGADPKLTVFTYNLTQSETSIGKRHFMARYSFTCLAANNPITTT